MMYIPKTIDLHMHTNVSDGTDTPAEILEKVKSSGIELFSVTDHDAISACVDIAKLKGPSDPAFINGVEFSCRDEGGKYHILGYGYDPGKGPVREVVATGHMMRLDKTIKRLDFLAETFGFEFTEEETMELMRNSNPGKPHIANLMVKKGFAETKEQAIKQFLNKKEFPEAHLRPEEAIKAILAGGGIPVLAHPSFGSGEELYTGQAMEDRLKKLVDFGLQGVEAYYSGFDDALHEEITGLAKKYDLYITAGSDYHGRNKKVLLAETHLSDAREAEEGLKRFLNDVKIL